MSQHIKLKRIKEILSGWTEHWLRGLLECWTLKVVHLSPSLLIRSNNGYAIIPRPSHTIQLFCMYLKIKNKAIKTFLYIYIGFAIGPIGSIYLEYNSLHLSFTYLWANFGFLYLKMFALLVWLPCYSNLYFGVNWTKFKQKRLHAICFDLFSKDVFKLF